MKSGHTYYVTKSFFIATYVEDRMMAPGDGITFGVVHLDVIVIQNALESDLIIEESNKINKTERKK